MKRIFFALLFMACPVFVMAQETDKQEKTGKQDNTNTQETGIDISDYEKIVVSINGGYSLRLEKVNSIYTGEMRDHMQKLNWGLTYQASAYYMFNYRLGAGLEYNALKTSDTMPGTYQVTAPNGQSGMTKISDDITISFYGAGILFNVLQESRHKLYFNASFGYMRYKNDSYFLGDYKDTAGGLGTSVGITYQYLIAKDFSIGPKLTFAGSSLKKFKTEGPDGYKDEVKYSTGDAIHFTRLDLGLQLMYRF